MKDREEMRKLLDLVAKMEETIEELKEAKEREIADRDETIRILIEANEANQYHQQTKEKQQDYELLNQKLLLAEYKNANLTQKLHDAEMKNENLTQKLLESEIKNDNLSGQLLRKVY
jgi:hypothetical protein